MSRNTTFLSAALVALVASPALADFDLYNGATEAGVFASKIAGFTFDDFDGAVVDGATSFTITTATDQDGANGLFGGIGRDLLNGVVEVNPATNQIAVEYRLLPGSVATSFSLNLIDVDGANSEQYQFNLNSANTSDAGDGFTRALFRIAATDAQFRQQAVGSPADGDQVANYGLSQWQIQSPFGDPSPLNLEIRRIAVIDDAVDKPIPEPS